MTRLRPTTIAFLVPATAVVGLSVLLSLRRGDAAVRPNPARFSGSRVIQPMPSLLADPRLAQRLQVGIVRDEAAASFYDTPAALDSIVGTWRALLDAIGADVTELSSAAAAANRAVRVLVVPGGPCLTVATREAMDAVTARGGGVILTGLAGYYDAACRPIGYGLVVSSTGASRADTLEKRPMVYVTFAAGNPLTADIPPGARLELDPARQVALRLPQRDAYYSDYSLQPQPASGSPLLDNALTHRALGRGRLVYWGFEPRDAVRRPWSTALLRLLVRNSVIWAAGASAATVEPWPRGKMAAAAVAQDVESQFGNARYALDSLRAAGFRGTYFLTSDLARRYDRLSHDLANGGEIGTHSENHRLLGGLPADLQRRRLEKSQDDLTAMFALPVEGLRPPEEQFDAATMSGWIAAGGRYVLGANDSRSASPELLPIGRDTIVLIGRVGSDDFAAAAATRNDTAKMAKLFLAEYRRIRGVGGAYVLSYHSQLLARPDFVPALARVARTLVSDTAVWVATTEEIAEWWRARAQLVATVRLRGDGFEVTVRNRGERLVRWAVLRVQLPEPRAVAGANAALLSTRGNEVRLLIPPVPGNVTRTYIVDYAGAKPRVSTRASSRLSPPRKKGRLWWWFRWWR